MSSPQWLAIPSLTSLTLLGSVQVGRLLESLNINPQHLPAHAHPHAWDALFQQGSQRGMGQPPVSHEVAAGGRMAAAQRPMDLKNGWAEDFARLQLRDGPPKQWAAEFDQRQVRIRSSLHS